jgi:hypothetical protein
LIAIVFLTKVQMISLISPDGSGNPLFFWMAKQILKIKIAANSRKKVA